MGLAEVLRHLPRLLRLRRELVERLLAARPTCFVGIDSPEFNLRVAPALKNAACRPCSTSARRCGPGGRAGCARSASRSTSCCACCRSRRISTRARRARGVRRPSARRPHSARQRPRRRARRARAAGDGARWSPCCRAAAARGTPPWAAVRGDARVAGRAPARTSVRRADGTASGASLRARASRRTPRCRRPAGRRPGAALHGGGRRGAARLGYGDAGGHAGQAADGGRLPRRAAHQLAAARPRLVKTQYFSQPNLLAGRALVPEYFQGQVRPDVLGPAVLGAARTRGPARAHEAFAAIHRRCVATRAPARPRRSSSSWPRRRARGERARSRARRVRLARAGGSAGVDEAGRGPLAGPVVAAVVVLDPARSIDGLADSKELRPPSARRSRGSAPRRGSWALGEADAAEIDQLNILQATLLAMQRALVALHRAAVPWSDGNRAPACADSARVPRGGGRGRRHGRQRSARHRSSPRSTATG